MPKAYAWTVLAPAILLLLSLCIPSGFANRHIAFMKRVSLLQTGVALTLALAATLFLAFSGPVDVALARFGSRGAVTFGTYFDSLAAVMMVLIAVLGFVVVRFSVRYLDGESTQGRFLRWMSFTLGSVLMLVLARDLVMFTVLWMCTSFGLHQLLTHYPERTWGVWAARKKFLISRLGDLMLVAALWLTWRTFGSFDYSRVFAAAQAMRDAGQESVAASSIGLLFALGAMTKSAQVPFHSWLPDTMEVPTPVSALMHAGIINAGGVLVIRMSPLVELSPFAMDLLAVVGAITALLGSMVMLTQTRVKRALAYSTIAQMGFMTLECGLGAFSAALLHIVAHSAYKAHAFLSSGSVLDQAAGTRVEPPRPMGPRGLLGTLIASCAVSFGLVASTEWVSTSLGGSAHGTVVLTLVLGIALTQIIWSAMQTGLAAVAIRGTLAAAGAAVAYYAGFIVMDHLLSASVSHPVVPQSSWHVFILVFVAAAFVGLLFLGGLARRYAHVPMVQRLYVTSVNAFYLESFLHRVTAWVWRRPMPVY